MSLSLSEVSRETEQEIARLYGNLADLIQMVNEGFATSLWVIGEAGIGKTTQISKSLRGNIERIGGHITPFQLYRKLFTFREGHILFFDDVESVMVNNDSKVMLKQALETSAHRIVSWEGRKSELPTQFELTSRVVFCVNKVPDDLGMKAIFSRSQRIDLAFDHVTKLRLMRLIARLPVSINGITVSSNERQTILDFIEQNSSSATQEFSLRTQSKIEAFYAFRKNAWKRLAVGLLKADWRDSLLVQMSNDSGNMSETAKQKEWSKLTGMSRASYYFRKRGLR